MNLIDESAQRDCTLRRTLLGEGLVVGLGCQLLLRNQHGAEWGQHIATIRCMRGLASAVSARTVVSSSEDGEFGERGRPKCGLSGSDRRPQTTLAQSTASSFLALAEGTP